MGISLDSAESVCELCSPFVVKVWLDVVSGELRHGTCHFCTRYTGVNKNQ